MLKVIWKGGEEEEEEGKKEKFGGEVKCENLLSNELITIITIINSQMNYSECKKITKLLLHMLALHQSLKRNSKL